MAYKNLLHVDDIGIAFPYSLLRTGKFMIYLWHDIPLALDPGLLLYINLEHPKVQVPNDHELTPNPLSNDQNARYPIIGCMDPQGIDPKPET